MDLTASARHHSRLARPGPAHRRRAL